ncbi:hypothetical protein ACJ41O_008448 [Fusarium nematophilum]
MSLEAQNASSLLGQAASLEMLPPEILLPIVTSISGLDTLWNLLRASPHVWRLFSAHSLAITEGILSGPNSILPPSTRQVVRGVILARSGNLPFRDLEEFHSRFMCGMMLFVTSRDKAIISLGPEVLSPSSASATALRSVIATAYQLSGLSQACLGSYLARLRDPSFRPLHALDPEPRYTDDYGPNDEWVPAWDREFIGTPANIVDAGQPSWVEEMRALRAMWIIQLVGEVQFLAENQGGLVGWSNEDVEMLGKMSPVDLVQDPRFPFDKAEEIRSAMQYLETLGNATKSLYYRLPRPPPTSATSRWITASPKRDEYILTVRGYRRNGEFHWLPGGTAVVPEGATPVKLNRFNDDHSWGQTEGALLRPACGMFTFRSLTYSGPNNSPIPGVKFDSFRPLGFAFWDKRRMHLLGLTPGIHRPAEKKNDFYFFAWESILPPDEVAGLKAELRKLGRILYHDDP